MAKYSNIFSDEEVLKKVVSECINKTQCLLKLDINPAGGNFKTLDFYIKKFNIDTSHFLGRRSNLGKKVGRKNVLEHCFNGSRIRSHKLKLFLFRDGYKEKKCEKCGITKWCGEEVILELDHIDGNKYNNELINLQILCPNCHALKTNKESGQGKQKYTNHNKLIKNIDNVLSNMVVEKTHIKCKVCNENTLNKSFCSNKCRIEFNRKMIPKKEELLNKIDSIGLNFSAFGREYSVSDNAVRKWFKKYNII